MARRGGVVATLLEDMDIPTIITESHTFRGQKQLGTRAASQPTCVVWNRNSICVVWNRNNISQSEMISCLHILPLSLNICLFGQLLS